MAEDNRAGQKPDAGEQAQQAGNQLREAVGQAATAAQEGGQKLATRAKREAQSYFSDRRDTVAVMISDVADATRQVAQTLRERDDTTIARYTEAVADQVEELVQYVENLEPAKVLRDLEGIARRQPVLFYGGLFFAGLAISRFLMASGRPNHGSRAASRDQFADREFRTEHGY
jgi:hypothetical protein